MPFHTSISLSCGATLVVWHLTEDLPDLLGQLPEAMKCELVEAGWSEKRLRERSATRLLLETMAETRGAQWGYTPDGAPRLLDRPGNISISHSREWVVVAFHPTLPIGVDVEQRGKQVEKVSPRVLSIRELEAFVDTPLYGVWLHLCWSAKEALFKAIPESEIDFREQLHIAPAPLSAEGYLAATESRTETGGEYTLWYRVCDDCVMVCAVPTTTQL